MPFTPFHLGPGAFLKSLFPKWISFRVFFISQFIMDLETAWNIFRGHARLHTLFHTYLGSNIVIVLTLFVVVAYNLMFLNGLKERLPNSLIWTPFDLKPALITSTLGVWSHVYLDSIMHADMTPFYPLSNQNLSLHAVSILTLHILCLAGFILAAIIYGLKLLVRFLLKLAYGT